MAQPIQFPVSKEGEPKVEGLILSVMDYEERNGIIHLATPDQIYSVYARGIQQPTSKNKRLAMPFSRVTLNYDPKYSRNMMYLINGSVDQNYWKVGQSLEMQTVSSILAALIESYGIDPQLYKDLEAFWSFLQQGDSNSALLHACRIVTGILKKTGTIMDVDECVVCQKKTKIAGVSVENGGFVCLEHFDPQIGDLLFAKDDLLKLRGLVKIKPDQLDVLYSFTWDLSFLVFLLDWLVYHNDHHLKSLDFLKTLLPAKKAVLSKEKAAG